MMIECLEKSSMEGIGRCSDMIWISFGKKIFTVNHRNEEVQKSEYEFHIQCPFRIIRDNNILLSNYDIYEVQQKASNEEWDVYGNNKYDKTVNEMLLPILPLKVIKVNSSKIGDIEILLEKNIVINIFVNSSDFVEEWRFINNNTGEHYVFREE